MLFFFKKLFTSVEAAETANATPANIIRVPAKAAEPVLGNVVKTAPKSTPAPSGAGVTLSLSAIVGQFPPELRSAVRKQPPAHVRIKIPREKIEAQLVSGVVRISFAELCAFSPPAFFSSHDGQREVAVRLPMPEILAQLTLAKRADQKQVELPTDAGEVFSRAGSAAPQPSQASGWYSKPRPLPQAAPVEKASVAEIVSPSPANAESAAPGLQKSATNFVEVPLAKVTDAFPETVRRELAGAASFSTIALRLPRPEIESAIKRGKVAFAWKQLQCWLSEPLTISMPAETVVDLPLRVVVPIFLASNKPAVAARSRIAEVDESIPDLFNKAAPKIAPRAAASEPTDSEEDETVEILDDEDSEMPVTLAREPAPLRLAPADDAAPIGAAPAAHHATPEQIVEQACALPNIEGAFVATHDGLFVAGRTPGMNERTMAAFVPNVFSQARAYTLVAKLGQPESVQIVLTDCAVQILRCGRLFFGVLGQAPFPNAQLREIAAQFHQSE